MWSFSSVSQSLSYLLLFLSFVLVFSFSSSFRISSFYFISFKTLTPCRIFLSIPSTYLLIITSFFTSLLLGFRSGAMWRFTTIPQDFFRCRMYSRQLLFISVFCLYPASQFLRAIVLWVCVLCLGIGFIKLAEPWSVIFLSLSTNSVLDISSGFFSYFLNNRYLKFLNSIYNVIFNGIFNVSVYCKKLFIELRFSYHSTAIIEYFINSIVWKYRHDFVFI